MIKLILISIIISLLISPINTFSFFPFTQEENPAARPLILIHGYKSSPFSSWFFYKGQLITDGYYEEPSQFLLLNEKWPNNSIISFTYYEGFNEKEGIEIYAKRLSKKIDEVLKMTGSKRVDILAHSMGGLVSRYYIENLGGMSKVRTLILAGTPNNGIPDFTDFVCYDSETACQQMKVNSSLMKSLNTFRRRNVKYITIAGDVLNSGSDLVVETKNVKIDCCSNFILENYNHWDLTNDPFLPDDREYRIVINSLIYDGKEKYESSYSFILTKWIRDTMNSLITFLKSGMFN